MASYGLENVLLAIGSNFLEVVAPLREGTAAGRYLQRRGGDGGYMVITQVDSRQQQAAIRQRAVDAGIRVAHEADRDGWNFCQLHPKDLEAAFLDIEWDAEEDFAGCWHPAGGNSWQEYVRRDVSLDILGVELQSVNPQKLAQLWGSILGYEVEQENDSYWLEFPNAKLRFEEIRDDRGAGLSAIDLLVRDRQKIISAAIFHDCYLLDKVIQIGGVRFNLQQ